MSPARRQKILRKGFRDAFNKIDRACRRAGASEIERAVVKSIFATSAKSAAEAIMLETAPPENWGHA